MSSESSLAFPKPRLPESQGRCCRKVQNATYESICRTTLIPSPFQIFMGGFFWLSIIFARFIQIDLKCHSQMAICIKTPYHISRNNIKFSDLNRSKTKMSSESSLAFPKPRLQRARADVEKSRMLHMRVFAEQHLFLRLFKFSCRGIFLAFYYLRQIHPDSGFQRDGRALLEIAIWSFVIEQSSYNLSKVVVPDVKISFPKGYTHSHCHKAK
ncbi:hypothetical protein CEXT_129361 [Caerostris extrusa]|uniref:Uncharacterized protein n=1 Tax=Caerostris extrusa TaxID=172846 RepID=A0AAV4XM61_CAEEX|nr:hypothetical protein CEXT_129361 [Caerostris extrusa]